MHGTQHIPHVLLALDPIIQKYGYLAVIGLVLFEDFGLPVPGETVLIAAAFYAGLGQLNVLLVVCFAIIGAIIGDNIGYGIGHFGGRVVIDKFGKYVFLTPERVDQVEAFFKKHGGKVIVIARFIEGLRQLNGIIAGLSEMPWFEFLIYNALGAVAWVTLWSLIGYFGGKHIETYLRYQLYITVAAVVLLIGFVAYHLFKRQSAAKSQTER
jgi:membrane protein DedA with SNARE-associated domain